MMEVGMARRSMVVKVDEVFNVEVSADIIHILWCRHNKIICRWERGGEERGTRIHCALPLPLSALPRPPAGGSTWPPGLRWGWSLQRGGPFWLASTYAHLPPALCYHSGQMSVSPHLLGQMRSQVQQRKNWREIERERRHDGGKEMGREICRGEKGWEEKCRVGRGRKNGRGER